MYEKIILKKKQPRTIAGTPAARFFLLKFVVLSVVPVLAMYCMSAYNDKKRNIFYELNEVDVDNRKLTNLQEYYNTRGFWNHPAYKRVSEEVLARYYMKKKLYEIGSGVTVKDLAEQESDE